MKSAQHTLRIIGGQWRGRKLAIPEVEGLRPTGDRIRETLFNWLQGDLVDAHCLDLYTGSGALGFEALSRGAAQVTLLEKNPRAAAQLRKHSTSLSAQHAEIIETDTLNWLANCPLEMNSIDIVFIDPPFQEDLWAQTIEALVASKILKDNSLIYIESDKHTDFQTPSHWQCYRDKKAGAIRYQLFISINPVSK